MVHWSVEVSPKSKLDERWRKIIDWAIEMAKIGECKVGDGRRERIEGLVEIPSKFKVGDRGRK